MDITIEGHKTGLQKVTLGKGKPLADRPKSYKLVETVFHSIGNAYNPSHAQLLKTSRGNLILEIYRDGCFWPYYCPVLFRDGGNRRNM